MSEEIQGGGLRGGGGGTVDKGGTGGGPLSLCDECASGGSRGVRTGGGAGSGGRRGRAGRDVCGSGGRVARRLDRRSRTGMRDRLLRWLHRGLVGGLQKGVNDIR